MPNHLISKEPWMEAAIKHSREEAPHEACGLIVVRKGRKIYIPCKNLLKHKHEQVFSLDPKDFIKAAESSTILGVFHSHIGVGSRPSQADLLACSQSGLGVEWYIYCSGANPEFSVIKPEDYKKPGLIGREWAWAEGIHGVVMIVLV